MADFGYDVTDYSDIDPLFGTLADFDAWSPPPHERGLQLILDFVPNHTSDQHPVVRRGARVARQPEARLVHLARPGAGRRAAEQLAERSSAAAPGSWTRATGQYYYHAFLTEQPDLNWRNPHVRAAMYDVLRFWLDRGVDGFRVDVIWHMIKDAAFRDNPPNPDYRAGMSRYPPRPAPLHTADQPEVHEIVDRDAARCSTRIRASAS